MKMKVFALSIAFALIAGCVSLSAQKGSYEPGIILVLPARDVVQAGVPHPVGAESGSQFTEAVIFGVNQSSNFTAISTSSEKFDHQSIANADDAVQEAKDLNADYVLITVLGEFRDAAPMTFRSDFVTLQSAKLYSVPSGNIVWQLAQPFRKDSGTNLGQSYALIEKIGQSIVISITE